MSFGTGSSSSGFNFGFGNQKPATTTNSNPAPSFNFSQQATTTASSGFNFGQQSNAAPANKGFSFGSATTTSSTGFNFAQPSSSTPATNASSAANISSPQAGFNFGAANATAPKLGGSGFSFGQAAAPAAGITSNAPPAFGQSVAQTMGQSAPMMGQSAPMMGQSAPTMGQSAPMMGQPTAPKLGQPMAQTLGQTATTLGQSTGFPTLGQLAAPPSSTSAGFSFGQPAAPTPSSGPSTTTVPSTSGATLGGSAGFNFSAPTTASGPSTSIKFTPQATATSVPPPAFNFNQASTSTAAPGINLGLVKPAAAPSGSPGFSLLGTKPTTLTTDSTKPADPATTTSKSLAGISLPTVAKTTSDTTSTTGLTGISAAKPVTTSTGVTMPTGLGTLSLPVSKPNETTTSESTVNMTYKQLENTLNKWNVDLEEMEKAFLQQATEINGWDRMLMESGDEVSKLHSDVELVKNEQTELSKELDTMLASQKELDDLLKPMEEEIERLQPVEHRQHADEEREVTYKMAEKVGIRMKGMHDDLKEIIEYVNRMSIPRVDGDKPDTISQITQILNTHTDSLQWIDTSTGSLNRKVEDLTKRLEEKKKMHEMTANRQFRD